MTEIDDSLYSRQRYVLGDGAMQRMARSDILLYGAGGLGAEIAKNIVLAGVKSLTVQDPATVLPHSLGTQFFLQSDDVKSQANRARASVLRLAELNPYVSVEAIETGLSQDSSLDYLKKYQCVIVTELPLSVQLNINDFCRKHHIKFISADVYGVFSWAFCDFGPEFEVVDHNGEEAKEVFISSVTSDGLVTTLDNRMHGFEDGDTVTFKEVHGMPALKDVTFVVSVQSPYTFSIGGLSGSEGDTHGGIARQVKVARWVEFESLEQQLHAPTLVTTDLAKLAQSAHLAMLALHEFRERSARLPRAWCEQDAAEMLALAADIQQREAHVSKCVVPAAAGATHLETRVVDIADVQQQGEHTLQVDEGVVRALAYTASGYLTPLAEALGGVVAQEAIKAITGKFTPLRQWLHLDAREVAGDLSERCAAWRDAAAESRYEDLRICVGDEVLYRLQAMNVFLVGCGAIGCEMLKNLALLGVGSSPDACVTVTDYDLIEKSNLNRQFLFRPHHIRQPKSTTAAAAIGHINAQLHLTAHQHKVCPQSEHVYTDSFFEAQSVVVNALDNVEARRYVDGRCVTAHTPLLESGTMGAKGHVQVIVPHLTESYTHTRDPADEDVPYCTLKSFPAIIDHCIQWARDKFESSFTQKPQAFNRFWDGVAVDILEPGREGLVQVSRLTAARPCTWHDCVRLARLKFDKYFRNKALQLLHAFPSDTRLPDGSLFWQLPKRPPQPQEFSASEHGHVAFVTAAARLYACMCGIPCREEDTQPAQIAPLLAAMPPTQFVPKCKHIETDERASKPEAEAPVDDSAAAVSRVQEVVAQKSASVLRPMQVAEFEKDDDTNAHIDLITAAANLRAAMYGIEPAPRLKVKRIAGRIVPAIATTTAAVAGLVTIELLKLAMRCEPDRVSQSVAPAATLRGLHIESHGPPPAGSESPVYRNTFLNLALPLVVMADPGAAPVTTLSSGVAYTAWDRWTVRGDDAMTLSAFLETLHAERGVRATMVVQGVKMVYVPMMPGHGKRLPQLMNKLVKAAPGHPQYVDLVVAFAGPEEDEMGPPVRYYFAS